MGRVRYAKSLRDMDRSATAPEVALASTVRSIRCVYETDAEVVEAVVPRPLEVPAQPEVCVSCDQITMHPTPGVEVEIRSACFAVRVDYDDRPGLYPITMPTSSEQAAIAGRERFGEPRKLAEIDFFVDERRDGQADGGAVSAATVAGPVTARVERMGVAFLSVTGQRVEVSKPRETTELVYCFKAFPSASGKGFDQDPQLVRLERRHRMQRVWRLEGGIQLWESPFDPVVDLPVRRLVELEYWEGTSAISGRALRPVPGEWLTPFQHQRYDAPGTEGVEV